MALCRSIVESYADPLWAIYLHKATDFFFGTGRRPGRSKSKVTRLFNSNHGIFKWMLAWYCFSISSCALSDSCHLHLTPHVRFFTRDWFFPVYIFQMQLHEMCALMQHALLSASELKLPLLHQLLIDQDDIELSEFDKIDKMPSEWSDTEKQSLWFAFSCAENECLFLDSSIRDNLFWIIPLKLYGTLICIQWSTVYHRFVLLFTPFVNLHFKLID